jgi:probable HAF family extracellular repeat protein
MERAKYFVVAGAMTALTSILISEPARADTERYEYVSSRWFDLGTLGGSYSAATDINEHLEIVGWSWLPDRRVHAFKMSGGIMTDLDPETFESRAYAINEASVVVGGRTRAVELRMQPVAYGPAGMRLLTMPTPPTATCSWRGEATDINDKMQIVGIARAVGPVTSVPRPVYGYPAMAELHRINNAGLAVGRVIVGGRLQPVSWRPGILRPLTLPTAPVVFEAGNTTGINDGGVVAGYSLKTGYRYYGRVATQWRTDTSPGEVFAIPVFESHEWAPWDINNQNFMVGEEEGVAWIWHKDFGLVFLPYPPGVGHDWCRAAAMTELRVDRIYAVGYCGNSAATGRAMIWDIRIRTVPLAP